MELPSEFFVSWDQTGPEIASACSPANNSIVRRMVQDAGACRPNVDGPGPQVDGRIDPQQLQVPADLTGPAVFGVVLQHLLEKSDQQRGNALAASISTTAFALLQKAERAESEFDRAHKEWRQRADRNAAPEPRFDTSGPDDLRLLCDRLESILSYRFRLQRPTSRIRNG